MALLDKLAKAGSVKTSSVLSNSKFFVERDHIKTDLPILNIAFSGRADGGLVSGLTVFSGASKSFKTMLALYCLKAYFDKYPDAVCLFYDSEFGSTPEYFETFGIDLSRVIHIPVIHVEEMKFDIVKRLEQIERGDHVFILLDSLGALPSKKEVEDAIEEKAVADMSRAKAIRSMLRIVTPYLTIKDLPFVLINHVYQTMEMYAKNVIPGGTAVTYLANQIFVITKAQEKEGDKLAGYRFTINIEKSRYVRERSKLPFVVNFEKGISKWSGLFDIAMDCGAFTSPSKGWYQQVGLNGEVIGDKFRRADTGTKNFWLPILDDSVFQQIIENHYALAVGDMMSSEQDEVTHTDDEE